VRRQQFRRIVEGVTSSMAPAFSLAVVVVAVHVMVGTPVSYTHRRVVGRHTINIDTNIRPRPGVQVGGGGMCGSDASTVVEVVRELFENPNSVYGRCGCRVVRESHALGSSVLGFVFLSSVVSVESIDGLMSSSLRMSSLLVANIGRPHLSEVSSFKGLLFGFSVVFV
jgi:hypothetical protein